ncbi:hypothetical protein GMORB2_5462, partial [Geosmithia morbida]
LLGRFINEGITLIEWDQRLLRRLGYPLATGLIQGGQSYFFLIPDDQLPATVSIAADEGLHPADDDSCAANFTSERSGRAIRYVMDDTTIPNAVHNNWRRLTEITLDELEPATMANPLHSEPPMEISIVPLPVVCAAYARLASRENRASPFDTSYEGDYEVMVPDSVPFTESELAEMENAAREIETWKSRPGEEWTEEHLINIVTAKASRDVPH